MKKWKLHELVPPWVDGKKHVDRLYTGLLFSAILSCMGFVFRMYIGWQQYHSYVQVFPDTRMDDFYAMTIFPFLYVSIFFGFVLTSFAAVILAISYYRGFRQGSEALYLMRRLPDRWELARRCLALPLLTIASCVLSILLLTLIFFGFYALITPEGAMGPDQWKLLWDHIGLLFIPVLLYKGG
ncbi:MAG: hypothetical protein J6K94_00535 [Ruminiclostridium sp.]|nr:hypothetical protein [Ruminiclostridium sp.]